MNRPVAGWASPGRTLVTGARSGRTLAVRPDQAVPRPGPAADADRTNHPPEDPSAPLVRAARGGDEAAFVALYRLYADRVYRFCLVRVGNAHDAEDLLQTTFLRVVEALPGYEERGLPFGAWVFRIARNATVDHHRRQARRGREDPLDGLAGSPSAAREHAAVLAERDALSRALSALTSDQRDVIHLRFFADLSARDAGLLLGRSEAAVRVLQARALGGLRRALGADDRRAPVLRLVGA